MSHELVGMKKVVFVVLATLWLFACKKEDGKKVEFHALPVSSIVSDTLEIDSVRMNTFFSNPTSLFIIDDSLLTITEAISFAILFIRKGVWLKVSASGDVQEVNLSCRKDCPCLKIRRLVACTIIIRNILFAFP